MIFGLFNGAIIAKTQIPPFIVTLASMNIAKGIAYVYSGGKPIRCMTDAWKFLGAGYIGPVPTQVVTMFVVFIISVLFLNRTRMGRHIYAVGGNDTAAKFSGISTAKVKFVVYSFSGLMAGLAGITIAPSVLGHLHFRRIRGNGRHRRRRRGRHLDVRRLGPFGRHAHRRADHRHPRHGLNLMGVNSDWQFIIKGVVHSRRCVMDFLRSRTAPRVNLRPATLRARS